VTGSCIGSESRDSINPSVGGSSHPAAKAFPGATFHRYRQSTTVRLSALGQADHEAYFYPQIYANTCASAILNNVLGPNPELRYIRGRDTEMPSLGLFTDLSPLTEFTCTRLREVRLGMYKSPLAKVHSDTFSGMLHLSCRPLRYPCYSCLEVSYHEFAPVSG
jgi:hypothetical protein